MLSIGLMSGTSMDGIDAALLETDGSPQLIEDLGHISLSYDFETKILFKTLEYAVRKCEGNLDQAKIYFPKAIHDYLANEFKLSRSDITAQIAELKNYLQTQSVLRDAIIFDHADNYSALPDIESRLHHPITFDLIVHHSTCLHIEAVKKLLRKTGYSASQIDVVGYHGQTLFHQPSKKMCVIVGDGQYLSDQLGITVVNDFRSDDIAAGGQGAPFAPLYHQALAIRDNKIPLAIVNCGGIANISLVRNENERDLIGFDPGPGNALIDRLVKQRTQGQESMDKDGRYGKNGCVDANVLHALYEKSIIKDGANYFLKRPPKSLDIGDITFIPELDSLSIEDACATLAAFVAEMIVVSLNLLEQVVIPSHWILAGGGWHNPVIRSELKNRLQQKLGDAVHVLTADEAGWNSKALEAQIFAYFAVRSLHGKPLSFPGTTGVPKPMPGGRIYRS